MERVPRCCTLLEYLRHPFSRLDKADGRRGGLGKFAYSAPRLDIGGRLVLGDGLKAELLADFFATNLSVAGNVGRVGRAGVR